MRNSSSSRESQKDVHTLKSVEDDEDEPEGFLFAEGSYKAEQPRESHYRRDL